MPLELARAIWELIENEVLDIPNSSYLKCSDEEAIAKIDELLSSQPSDKV
jgi:hypothetical protein